MITIFYSTDWDEKQDHCINRNEEFLKPSREIPFLYVANAMTPPMKTFGRCHNYSLLSLNFLMCQLGMDACQDLVIGMKIRSSGHHQKSGEMLD